jgi:rubrerythrin
MHKMTKANLEAAFAGESQAHMRYLAFAEKAEREGFPQVARLFRALSFAEQIHAIGHLRVLESIGQTVENLKAAMGGENYEVDEMYPAFEAVAELQGEKAAARSDRWAMEAEKVHAGLYKDALGAVEAGKDAELGPVYVCSNCGWTGVGEPPDECPLCKAKKDKFMVF